MCADHATAEQDGERQLRDRLATDRQVLVEIYNSASGDGWWDAHLLVERKASE